MRPGSLQLGFHVENVDKFITDARTAGVRVLQDPVRSEPSGALRSSPIPDGYVIQVFSPKHAGAARR